MGDYYKDLLSNLCCSNCRSVFDENAFVFVRKEKELRIAKMVCPNCGKDYGLCFIKSHPNVGQPHEALKVV